MFILKTYSVITKKVPRPSSVLELRWLFPSLASFCLRNGAFAPSQILPAFSFSLMGLSHLGRIKVDILGSAMFIPRDSGLVIETLFYIQGR